MKNIVLIVILISGLSLVAFPMMGPTAHAFSCPYNGAQNEVEGCVVDASTGNPVSGLNVYMLFRCPAIITGYITTDGNGYFNFQPTHVNGTPCIYPGIAYPVTVNGVTTITWVTGCYVPNCNILGQAVDNPAWGQWAGDVSTSYPNANGQITIQLQPGAVRNMPVAALYSDTNFAKLTFSSTTSTSISLSFSGNVGGATAGFSGSETNTFQITFGPFGPNSAEIVAYPYYVIPYYCAGSSSFSSDGWSCSQGLIKAGTSGPVPPPPNGNGAYVYIQTSEYLPYQPNRQGSLTCPITGPQTISSQQDLSFASTFGYSTPNVSFYGVDVSFSFTVTTSSSTGASTAVSIDSTNGVQLHFQLYPASGTCPGPQSAVNFGPELHVWDTDSAPDYSISTNPNALTIYPSGSAQSTVNLASINGLSGTVSLAANAPSGISVSLNPPIVNFAPRGSSTATITLSNTIPSGIYQVTITSTCNTGECNPTITHTASIMVNVPDFSISANPNSANIVPNTLTSSSITVSPLYGFTGTVNLGLQISPSSGLSCSLSPNSVTLLNPATSTLTCSGNVGSYMVTVTGTSPSQSHSTTFAVTVATYVLSLNPSELDWICSPHGCNPGRQSSTIQISTNVVSSTSNSFTLVYGCGPGSPSCNPVWVTQPNTITILAGQTSGTASLTIAPGSGQSCTQYGGRTDCYTYITITARLSGNPVAATTLTLYTCHGICPV